MELSKLSDAELMAELDRRYKASAAAERAESEGFDPEEPERNARLAQAETDAFRAWDEAFWEADHRGLTDWED